MSCAVGERGLESFFFFLFFAVNNTTAEVLIRAPTIKGLFPMHSENGRWREKGTSEVGGLRGHAR